MFDAVMSVDAVGVFNTHPKVYQYALDTLALPARAIAFQSSNAWDAHAASDFGVRVVWCNRYGQRRERLPGAPDFEIRTLAELPGLSADRPLHCGSSKASISAAGNRRARWGVIDSCPLNTSAMRRGARVGMRHMRSCAALDRYSGARRGCAFRTGALSFIAFCQIGSGRMNQCEI
jgi:hypothetical protein